LFSSEKSDRSKTEIVLLITPRVVRNLAIATPDRNEHLGGTEAAVGALPLRVQGAGKLAMPAGGGPRRTGDAPNTEQVQTPESEPEPEPVPVPDVPPPPPPTSP
jgi:general secretion pathway protein D